MTFPVSDWLAKAEEDYRSACLLTINNEMGDYSAGISYSAQQCIEKLLKAALVAKTIEPPRIHNLVELAQVIQDNGYNWLVDLYDLQFLSTCAVEFRYPGRWAERQDAEEACALCQTYRTQLLSLLNNQPKH